MTSIRVSMLVIGLGLAGCSSPSQYVAPAPSHPFEPRLYLAADVPRLSEPEWAEIAQLLGARSGYAFHHGTRLAEDSVRVVLVRIGGSNGRWDFGVSILFRKVAGHWVEQPEEEAEVQLDKQGYVD